jgi:hypothetical protein
MTWEKDDPRPDALRGKTVVTRASSGLGKAAAAAMAPSRRTCSARGGMD